MKLPSLLTTGIDSPVTNDSSAALLPSTTVPSAGILAPGTTFNRSPL